MIRQAQSNALFHLQESPAFMRPKERGDAGKVSSVPESERDQFRAMSDS